MVIASYGNPIFSVQVGWLATGRHPGLNDLYKKNFVRGNIMRVSWQIRRFLLFDRHR